MTYKDIGIIEPILKALDAEENQKTKILLNSIVEDEIKNGKLFLLNGI